MWPANQEKREMTEKGLEKNCTITSINKATILSQQGASGKDGLPGPPGQPVRQ